MKDKDPSLKQLYRIKRLLYLVGRSSSSGGFTLLELIVVFVFLGILSAVSIPVFLGQIGKGREAELMLTIGTMARSQQSYHYIHGEFALTLAQIEGDSGRISAKYHDVDNITGDATKVKMQAVALNPSSSQVRDYAVGVYFVNSSYLRATCQGAVVGSPVQVGDTPSDPCSNNGIKLY
jgi:type IV pilus assembly protein PilA